jgi:hypothetical protein
VITRAEIETELAKYDTQEAQIAGVRSYLESNLAASPVVNGPLREFMNAENVSLADIIVDNLSTYRNWISDGE